MYRDGVTTDSRLADHVADTSVIIPLGVIGQLCKIDISNGAVLSPSATDRTVPPSPMKRNVVIP